MQKTDEVQQVKKVEDSKEAEEELGVNDVGEDRGEFHNLVDILFVIDATGSMSWCMSQMKHTIKKIIAKFAQKQYNIKFAIELYRDHPPQEYSFVEKHFDLRNQQDIIKVIDKECEVAGGGDTPEAVMDGLAQGLMKTNWRVSSDGKTQSKRFLFHGCDAPPHGDEYGSNSSDANWRKNGCPCKITRHDIKTLLLSKQVDYSLIKCGKEADVMESLFKECFEGRFKRVVEITRVSASKKKYAQSGSESEDEDDEEECEVDLECAREGSLIEEGGIPYVVDELDMKEVMHHEIEKAELEPQKEKGFFRSLKDKLFGGGEKKKKAAPPMREEKDVVMKCAAMQCEAPARKRVKKEKKKKEKKAKKQKEESDGSDELNRSMASLVLSEVEDGVGDYFGEDLKKDKKKKRRGSADLKQEEPAPAEAGTESKQPAAMEVEKPVSKEA